MSISPAIKSHATVDGHRHGRVPKEVRARQLLEIASTLLREHGYDGFSIEALCKAAGVSRPVVYDHFGSKEGIFIAYIRSVWQRYDDALTAAGEHTDAPEKLIGAGSEAFFAAVEDDPTMWTLAYSARALGGPVADEFDRLRGASISRIALLARVLAPQADDERLEAAANFISGAGEQLGWWWLRNPSIPRARIVAYHRDFITSMLADLQAQH